MRPLLPSSCTALRWSRSLSPPPLRRTRCPVRHPSPLSGSSTTPRRRPPRSSTRLRLRNVRAPCPATQSPARPLRRRSIQNRKPSTFTAPEVPGPQPPSPNPHPRRPGASSGRGALWLPAQLLRTGGGGEPARQGAPAPRVRAGACLAGGAPRPRVPDGLRLNVCAHSSSSSGSAAAPRT